uniref:DDE Tnp4 domain-containing protein n=1 Tax=Sipha flava TaxID=143950 RepID=A0A2S2QKX9_9HEMI
MLMWNVTAVFQMVVIFANCSLSKALVNNTLNIPQPKPLRGQSNSVPFVIVADDAFPLKTYLIKPFPFRNQPEPNRIFNFRLSCSQSCGERVWFAFCSLSCTKETYRVGSRKNHKDCACHLLFTQLFTISESI